MSKNYFVIEEGDTVWHEEIFNTQTGKVLKVVDIYGSKKEYIISLDDPPFYTEVIMQADQILDILKKGVPTAYVCECGSDSMKDIGPRRHSGWCPKFLGKKKQ